MPKKREAPESYRGGIAFIEAMSANSMLLWLFAELFEREGECHRLAGSVSQMDYPVQAILNHYTYLSNHTQLLMVETFEEIARRWALVPTEWPEEATAALLSLVGELPVLQAKSSVLQPLAKSKDFNGFSRLLKALILSSIAQLSTRKDYDFWKLIAEKHSEFGGMAFQVLWRLDQNEAVQLLQTLDLSDESVRGSVERACSDYKMHLMSH